MLIIGVTGGTGSGKTTLVSKLVKGYKSDQISVISQDSYYKKTDHLTEDERNQLNFDHPNAIDFDLLSKQLLQLKNNIEIEEPIYSFLTHNRTQKTKTIIPKKIIIVEGILIFNDKRILNLCDLKVFVHTDADIRLKRRIIRDSRERGRSSEEVKHRYYSTLKPMHDLYIEPYKNNVDIVIDGKNDNPNIVSKLIKTIQKRSN